MTFAIFGTAIDASGSHLPPGSELLLPPGTALAVTGVAADPATGTVRVSLIEPAG